MLADSFDFGAVEQKRHLSMLEVRSRGGSGDVRPGLVTKAKAKTKANTNTNTKIQKQIRSGSGDIRPGLVKKAIAKQWQHHPTLHNLIRLFAISWLLEELARKH